MEMDMNDPVQESIDRLGIDEILNELGVQKGINGRDSFACWNGDETQWSVEFYLDQTEVHWETLRTLCNVMYALGNNSAGLRLKVIPEAFAYAFKLESKDGYWTPRDFASVLESYNPDNDSSMSNKIYDLLEDKGIEEWPLPYITEE